MLRLLSFPLSFFFCVSRVGEGEWGRTWSKGNRRHHSTEEEEEDEEEEEEALWTSAEMRRVIFSRTHTPGSGKLLPLPCTCLFFLFLTKDLLV